jgi:ABC-type polysaccharide/polyol phosphate transport system ATPase subunit
LIKKGKFAKEIKPFSVPPRLNLYQTIQSRRLIVDIHILQLAKNYSKFRALSKINLSIPGGMFGLLGPNGAGKTTLMRILSTS